MGKLFIVEIGVREICRDGECTHITALRVFLAAEQQIGES